jgi:hypothetical protein
MVEKLPPFFFKDDTPMEEVEYHYRKMIEAVFEGHIKEWQESILGEAKGANR